MGGRPVGGRSSLRGGHPAAHFVEVGRSRTKSSSAWAPPPAVSLRSWSIVYQGINEAHQRVLLTGLARYCPCPGQHRAGPPTVLRGHGGDRKLPRGALLGPDRCRRLVAVQHGHLVVHEDEVVASGVVAATAAAPSSTVSTWYPVSDSMATATSWLTRLSSAKRIRLGPGSGTAGVAVPGDRWALDRQYSAPSRYFPTDRSHGQFGQRGAESAAPACSSRTATPDDHQYQRRG